MEWFYASNGRQVGPVSEEEFQRLVAAGTIRADTLVWRSGMANWQAYTRAIALAQGGAGDPATTSDDTAVCAVSGKRHPKREMIEYRGKWISAEHKDEFFQRLREGVIAPGDMVYGGFWLRFVAKFIDGLTMWVVSFAINSVIGMIMFGAMLPAMSSARPAQNMGKFFLFQGITLLLNLGMQFAYSFFFVSRYAATPGKMALGLKIVRADGSPLSKGRVAGRYFGEWVTGMTLGIGYLIAAFDEQKRTVHDRICDTRVIRSR